MGSSPFHGIFAALTQAQAEEKKGSFQEARAEVPQEPVMQRVAPVQQSQSVASSQVGRVAVDIFEQDNYYIIKAPIAGVRLSDIDIEVNGNVVTISGTRKQTDTAEDGQYFLRECFWGPFSRSVTLPMDVDARKIRATFNKECILKILVPKEERVKIVKINEA